MHRRLIAFLVLFLDDVGNNRLDRLGYHRPNRRSGWRNRCCDAIIRRRRNRAGNRVRRLQTVQVGFDHLQAYIELLDRLLELSEMGIVWQG